MIMDFIIFGLVSSLLVVLILGVVLLRKWWRTRIDLAMWSGPEQHPQDTSRDADREAWHGNKEMHMK